MDNSKEYKYCTECTYAFTFMSDRICPNCGEIDSTEICTRPSQSIDISRYLTLKAMKGRKQC